MMNKIKKTTEELKSLNTKNLLRYYRAERMRFNRSGFRCSCCGELVWEVKKGREYLEKEYMDWKNYLDIIKQELNSREHVDKKVKHEKR